MYPFQLVAFIVIVVSVVGAHANSLPRWWCDPSQSCWPSPDDVAALGEALDPDANRTLRWPGGEAPMVCAIPAGGPPGNQPLFGAGVNGMKPAYGWKNGSMHANASCFQPQSYVTEICLMAVRDTPYENWQPGVVVWALNARHVQLALQFARRHRMCVMVAGSGHDFQNRHSCPFGVFIRTTLIQDMTYLPAPSSGAGSHGDAFRFGAGIVFSKAHQFAAAHNRVIASGWASTVGIAGWSIGGGHGPLVPGLGLGVDNVVEVELVDANGRVLVANATHNDDLWWAFRGGGGSAWGVIIHITVRAHPIPVGGFTSLIAVWAGPLCPGSTGVATLQSLAQGYLPWALNRTHRWGGLAYFVSLSTSTSAANPCGKAWEFIIDYIFQGGPQDPEFQSVLAAFATYPPTIMGPNVTNYPTMWDKVKSQKIEYIDATPVMSPIPHRYAGAMASVLVNRSVAGDPATVDRIMNLVQECVTSEERCGAQQIYHDITGNVGSDQSGNISTNPAMRDAIFHWVCGSHYNQSEIADRFYAMGDHSYFSESAYDMPNWRHRYWGDENFAKLTSIKGSRDPRGVFWCRHCVGDDSA